MNEIKRLFIKASIKSNTLPDSERINSLCEQYVRASKKHKKETIAALNEVLKDENN